MRYKALLYEVKFESAGLKILKKLPKKVQVKVIEKIEALAYDPRPDGCKKLSGREKTYRVRLGDYRIVYEIHDGVLIVIVVHIGHRKDVYR